MSATAPPWCVECDSWNGSPSACGQSFVSVGQVVTRKLASFQRLPTRRQQSAWCTRCRSPAVSSDASNAGDKREHQQLLWKPFFLDHTRWWDNRRQRRSTRSSDSLHKECGDAMWLNHCYKPSWVDSQVAILDAGAAPAEFATAVSFLPTNADLLVGQGFKNHVTPEFVKRLCKEGKVKEAVEVLKMLGEASSGIDRHLVYFVLKECVARKDLMHGGQLHALAVNMGFGSDSFLCSHFIRMYAAHGKLREAMDVFRGVALPDAFTWSAIITAHTKQGQAGRAIELYQEMRATRANPDNYLFVAALQACAAAGDLRSGRQVHSQIEEHDFEPDVALGGSLVNMYAKCGSVRDARIVFDGLREKSVVTWSAMIAGYAQQQGMGQDALSLYSAMRNKSVVVPDAVTFVSLLQACANMGVSALEQGKQVHADIKARGVQSDVAVGGSLVNMYVKCGSLRDAKIVFEGLREKNVVTWNAMIGGYAQQEGMGQDAFSLYSAMRNGGMVPPNAVTFVCLLQACANMGVSALDKGKQVHADIKVSGVQSDVTVGGSLVNMYAKCGSLRDARMVFDGLCEKSVVTWSAMIAGYAEQEGMGQEALSLYSAMQNEGMVVPDAVTFVCLLKACANMGVSALEKGKQLHSDIIARGVQSNVTMGGSLVNMYAKCGSLRDARIVFDGLREKNVVTWSAMIAGYAQQEGMLCQDALSLYSSMRDEGMAAPDAVTFVCLLQACAKMGVSALEKGKKVHSDIKSRGLQSDVAVGSSLVNMYAKCGSLRDARIVFDGLSEKRVVTWSAMIAGYAQQEGMGQDALSLYSAMRNEGMVVPDAVTFVCLLQACANMGASALEKGKQVHSDIEACGVQSDVAVAGSLVNMYAKCGSLRDARIVFDGLCEKNVVTWNAMIAGYAQQEGMGQDAFSLYSAMHNEGMVVPNAVTFVCLLQACASMGVSALEKGKEVHSDIKVRGVGSDVVVGGSLVNMYAKCGSLRDARIVFDGLCEKNVVTWNAMIGGYALEGLGQDALSLYSSMRNEVMVSPDVVTFVCLLQACAYMGVSALEQGKQVHSDIRAHGFLSDVTVGGSLVNMYAKCGSVRDARTVFDGLCEKSVVTWSAMIAGYAEQEGMGQDALSLYSAMRNEGKVVPDAVTFVCLLKACASVAALQQGQELHSEIREKGLESDALIGTSLVNMYAQCGCLEIARQIFDRLPMKSVESWSALINGYAELGDGGMAIQCFEELLELGTQPDDVTFICLLTACSRAGLVVEGQEYFDTMEERHGVKPDERHYNCMVDLLGRSGHLGKAEQMLLGAPCLAGSVVGWTALLSACKTYGDADRGRRCFEHLVNLESAVATAYVLMGSIYANSGRWEEVEKVEILRKAAGATKKEAIACIEVKDEVHKFTVGEERSDIAVTLRKMNARVKEGGHVPQTQLVLRANVSEQEKEDSLCGHAEKLALAYGLVNTPAGSTLLVTKNLRMCNDCHSSTKIMSRVEKREIVVRDGNKVHRFQNGACSCQDKP